MKGSWPRRDGHVERAHGADVADEWRRDLFTAQARLEVRRLLASSPDAAPPHAQVREVQVDEADGGLLASMPAAVAAALPCDGLERLQEALRRLGGRLGAQIALEVNDGPSHPPKRPRSRIEDGAVEDGRVVEANARISSRVVRTSREGDCAPRPRRRTGHPSTSKAARPPGGP